VKAPEPKPLQLAVGKPLALKTWHPAAETDGLELARKALAGAMALHDATAGRAATNRGTAVAHPRAARQGPVPAARHRALQRTSSRRRRTRTATNTAACGCASTATVSERLLGDRNWQALVCDFEVGEFQRNVELACEVRAFLGKAWFRGDSLALVRLPE
jgi:hypothetical protein